VTGGRLSSDPPKSIKRENNNRHSKRGGGTVKKKEKSVGKKKSQIQKDANLGVRPVSKKRDAALRKGMLASKGISDCK